MINQIHEIHRACLDNDIKKFNKLIKDKKFRVNIRDNIKFTPLMCAAHSGNLQMVKKLLKFKNIKVNTRSRNSKAPS